MRIEDLDYVLPPELIAQRPLSQRDASRMLVLDPSSGDVQDSMFQEFTNWLRGDELLVFNNAKVIPARLLGRLCKNLPPDRDSKQVDRSKPIANNIEVFLARKLSADTWESLVRPGRKLQIGSVIDFGQGELQAEVIDRGDRGLRKVRLSVATGRSVDSVLEQLGHIPLPPYISRPDDLADRSRYQTVFAKQPGAVAAPTAGLHFTEQTLAALSRKGISCCEITLDVGLGTFQPIHADDLSEHRMHTERYEISEQTACVITNAKHAGRPVVAIGTTVVRALEDAAQRASSNRSDSAALPGVSEASLFITPGFQFRVVDALLTNFHLPRSTLLALVFALAGRGQVMTAYAHAIANRYRFYSYGDCMFIPPKRDR